MLKKLFRNITCGQSSTISSVPTTPMPSKRKASGKEDTASMSTTAAKKTKVVRKGKKEATGDGGEFMQYLGFGRTRR